MCACQYLECMNTEGIICVYLFKWKNCLISWYAYDWTWVRYLNVTPWRSNFLSESYLITGTAGPSSQRPRTIQDWKWDVRGLTRESLNLTLSDWPSFWGNEPRYLILPLSTQVIKRLPLQRAHSGRRSLKDLFVAICSPFPSCCIIPHLQGCSQIFLLE